MWATTPTFDIRDISPARLENMQVLKLCDCFLTLHISSFILLFGSLFYVQVTVYIILYYFFRFCSISIFLSLLEQKVAHVDDLIFSDSGLPTIGAREILWVHGTGCGDSLLLTTDREDV